MIRRVSSVEIITFGYLLFFFTTLFIEPKLFENEKSDLYKALLKVIHTQDYWILTSLILIAIFIVSLFIKHHIVRMTINFVFGSFMLLVSVTYIFTYPNIGAGLFLMVGIMHFVQIFKISNKYEHDKTEKLKKKMNTKELLCKSTD